MTWSELSKYDIPADYPVGGLEEMLDPEVKEYLGKYNLHEMKYEEIRDLLFQIRRDLNLRPWNVVTPVLQAYAYANWIERGKHLKNANVGWITTSGGYRPLSLYSHNYENTHPVYADVGSGEQIYVGDLILKADGNDVFQFWGIYTERLIADCSKISPIRHPVTGDSLFTSTVLATWEPRTDISTGHVVVKVLSRRHRSPSIRPNGETESEPNADKKPRVRVRMEQSAKPLMDLTLSSAATEKRKLLIDLFAQSASRAVGTVTAVETLSKVLADYVERLGGDDIPVAIPDTVLIACWSFVQMHGDSDVGRAAKYWYDALTRTDSTRVSLGGSIVP